MNKFRHTIFVTNTSNPEENKEEVATVVALGDAIIIRDAMNVAAKYSPLEYTLETKQVKFSFDELSEDKQAMVLNLKYGINIYHDWFDCLYDEAKNLGFKITEFDIDRGSYCNIVTEEDVDDIMRNILKSHGETCDTFIMATEYWGERDNLVNKYSTQKAETVDDDKFDEFDEEETELNEEYKKRLAEEYLSLLRKEYEYLISDEAIKETIEANEYEFTEEGEIC